MWQAQDQVWQMLQTGFAIFHLIISLTKVHYILEDKPQSLFPYLATTSFMRQNTTLHLSKFTVWLICPIKIY